ncbi:MAG: hypothetical protein WDA27_02950 [Actinomycetota bacterium]
MKLSKIMAAPLAAAILGGLLVAAPTLSRAADSSCATSCHNNPSSSAPQIIKPVTVQSARDWLSTAGQGSGKWTERGTHSVDQLADCGQCHVSIPGAPSHTGTAGAQKTFDYPAGADPTTPGADCATACHKWVPKNTEVTSHGFPGTDGVDRTYQVLVNPADLLALPKIGSDPATPTKHSVNFGKNGCANCHDAKQHGVITECISCHAFGAGSADSAAALPGKINPDDPNGSADSAAFGVLTLNMHATHIPFLAAEQPANDPSSQGQAPCSYCHGPEGNAKRSCWNCHVSGHNPSGIYFKPA